MRILSFGPRNWEADYLKGRLVGQELTSLFGTVQDHKNIGDDDVEAISFFVDSTFGREEMERFPKLRLIATRSTGYDHIDVALAKEREIAIATVPSYGENTVAEYTFALLLAISRRIYETADRIRETGSFSQDGLMGFDLAGKTLGVVGGGRIGMNVIKIANGFGMDVIVYDLHHNEQVANEQGFRYTELDELLGSSDVITLHAPYNEHTHHMLNMENVTRIKRGAVLINTARGGLIETAALVKGLEDGNLYGAGLDVLEEENYMKHEENLLTEAHPNPIALKNVLSNHYLIDHPNVIITPHNAFHTREAITRIIDTTASNIIAFAANKPENLISV